MPQMIDTIALRRMSFNGEIYEAGGTVPMSLGQYQKDFGPKGLGWVELPSTAPKVPKAKKAPAKPAA